MSETKWRLKTYPGTLRPAEVFGPTRPDGSDYAPICRGDPDKMAFIVRAFNSHDALLEELKDMVQLAGTMTDLEPHEIARIEKAEAAIALAER